MLEGTGRMRVGGEVLTLDPLSAVVVEPDIVRQVFNDTAADALWLVMGAPQEAAATQELTLEMLALLLPGRPAGAAARAGLSELLPGDGPASGEPRPEARLAHA